MARRFEDHKERSRLDLQAVKSENAQLDFRLEGLTVQHADSLNLISTHQGMLNTRVIREIGGVVSSTLDHITQKWTQLDLQYKQVSLQLQNTREEVILVHSQLDTAATEILTQRDLISELENALETQKQFCANQKDNINSLLVNHEEETLRLREQSASLQSRLDDTLLRLETRENESGVLMTRLEESRAEIQKVTNQVDQLSHQLNITSQKVEQKSEENDNLQRLLGLGKAEVETVSSQLLSNKKKLRKCQKDLSSQNKMTQELTLALETSKNEIGQILQDLSHAQAELEKSTARVVEQTIRGEALEASLETSNTEKQSLTDQLSSLRDELGMINDLLNEQRLSNKEMSTLRESERLDAQSVQRECQKLTKLVQKTEATVESVTLANQQLQLVVDTQVNELHEKEERIVQFTEELGGLRTMIDDQKLTINEMRSNCNGKERTIDELSTHINTLNRDVELANSQLSQLQHANKDLLTQLAHCKERLSRANEQVGDLQREGHATGLQIDDLRAINDSQRIEMGHKDQEISILRSTSKGTTNECVSLQMALKEREKIIEELRTRENAISEELSQLKNWNAKEITRLRETVTDGMVERDSLQHEIDRLRAESAAESAVMTKREEKLEEMEEIIAGLQNSRAEVESVRDELRICQQQLRESRQMGEQDAKTIVELKNDVERCVEDNNSLLLEVDTLKRRIEMEHNEKRDAKLVVKTQQKNYVRVDNELRMSREELAKYDRRIEQMREEKDSEITKLRESESETALVVAQLREMTQKLEAEKREAVLLASRHKEEYNSVLRKNTSIEADLEKVKTRHNHLNQLKQKEDELALRDQKIEQMERGLQPERTRHPVWESNIVLPQTRFLDWRVSAQNSRDEIQSCVAYLQQKRPQFYDKKIAERNAKENMDKVKAAAEEAARTKREAQMQEKTIVDEAKER
ncbi:spindle pole body component 110-like [Octopus sinensis]|uniref:Spindle pole body component 110-like n=1 Tax=Octopus sinensis TaxID=2607531 RepID=A0A7E6EIV3_9MOLL|nr:spindle pole body component 110-like [Octopus sinensis]